MRYHHSDDGRRPGLLTAGGTVPACFKAYDVRGRVPDELDEDLAWRIGRAYARVVEPNGPVAVGRDVRPSGEALAQALTAGLNAEGVASRDLGLCGTEMVYFAAARAGMGGGIMVTASHNPPDYNGMKFVRAGAVPISGDTGLRAVGARANRVPAGGVTRSASSRSLDLDEAYRDTLHGLVDITELAPLHMVVDAGNGCAGPTFDLLADGLPINVTRIRHAPDGQFPAGVPNPLLAANRKVTAAAVQSHGADLGVAWDGDFDRCFFFDEQGRFIESYYIIALLVERILARHTGAGARVVHDPRLIWSTVDAVRAAGGVPVLSKTGHAFIKERMRREDAVYGGEMSGHHYFRDFAYSDSGMIPWLILLERLSAANGGLSTLVDERASAYPCSGELNFRVDDVEGVCRRILDYYGRDATVDFTDGISIELAKWRFNLRSSNTEPVLRLNVEARGDRALLEAETKAVCRMIEDLGGVSL